MSGTLWIARWRGQRWGTAGSRGAAMNLVDHPYRTGWCEVEHESTGELWERRKGSWVKVQAARPKARA